jgi:DNA-binding HxlR family transcriptional regulator
MTEAHRSGCPISMPLDIFGEKWSLLILRGALLPGSAAAIRRAIVDLV